MQENRSLYRTRADSVIAGVAGGIGRYFNVDSIIFRVAFVLLALFGGGGILIYLILWIAIPLEPIETTFQQNNNATMEEEKTKTESTPQPPFEPPRNQWPRKGEGNLIAGLVLITIGIIFLVDRFVPRIDFGDLWPVILLVAGIVLIRMSFVKPKNRDHRNET